MAVRSREEITSQLSTIIGDSTSDEAIALFEDLADTFSDLEGRANPGGTDWKAEAERIDKEWREKYVNRFKSGGADGDPDDDPKPEPNKALTFENLFK